MSRLDSFGFDMGKKRELDEIKKLLRENPLAIHDYSTIERFLELGCYELFNIKFLIKCGFQINAPLNDGGTLLHIMTIKDSYGDRRGYRILTYLLEHGADVNAVDDSLKTPLHYVANVKTLELFLKYGADINKKSRIGESVLYSILVRGCTSDIYVALYKMVDNLSQLELQLLLSKISCPNIISELIKKGANPNLKIPNSSNTTPLEMAVLFNRVEIARTLLENGAIPDINDMFCREKQTTLFEQASHYKEMTELLMNYGADFLNLPQLRDRAYLIKKKKNAGCEFVLSKLSKQQIAYLIYDALKICRYDDISNEISELIEDMDENYILQNGMTMLKFGCKNDYPAIIWKFARFAREDRDRYGRSPLHYCKTIDAINTIIKYEDVNVQDGVGNTIVHKYQPPKISSYYALLLEYGLKPTIKNMYGKPAHLYMSVYLPEVHKYCLFLEKTESQLNNDIYKYIMSFYCRPFNI